MLLLSEYPRQNLNTVAKQASLLFTVMYRTNVRHVHKNTNFIHPLFHLTFQPLAATLRIARFNIQKFYIVFTLC